MPAGRPTKYKPEYAEQARKICLLGATDEELAAIFDVEPSTLYLWKQKHPEFSEALKKGKVMADAHVAERLYNRAMGYEQPIEKVFCSEGLVVTHDTLQHIPADTTAAIFWLKNRQPDKWRDRRETAIDPGPVAQDMADKGKPWAIVTINGVPYGSDPTEA